MGEFVRRVMEWAWVQHLLRALGRFGSRLGSQFAAAITYFSVLAIVPILMFAFSVFGFTIDVLRPDLIPAVTDWINTTIGIPGGSKVAGLVVDTLKNWRGTTIVALLGAAYAGAGWVGNVQQAINAMWHPEGITTKSRTPLQQLLHIARNLAVLLGLLVLGALTVTVSLTATAAQDVFLTWLGLADSSLASVLTVIAAVVVSLIAGWLLFAYLYTVLPWERRSLRAVAQGAMFGSLGLAALQYFAGTLNGIFSHNRAASLFGPVIVIVLSLNIFATLVMMGAAWTATTAKPEPAEDPGDPEPEMIPLSENPLVTGEVLVPRKVASRGVTVGIAAGYALGGAAGLGVGALLGRLAGAVAHRRRRR